jgi:hypothetical protein
MGKKENVSLLKKDEPNGESLYESYNHEEKQLSPVKRNVKRRQSRAHTCHCGAVFSGWESLGRLALHQELQHKMGALA